MKTHVEQAVHVRLDAPLIQRRAVLQTTLDTLQLIKRYDRLMCIRRDKEQEYLSFRRVIASINRLVKEIRVQELPLDEHEIHSVKRIKNPYIVAPILKRVEKTLHTKGKKEKEHHKSSLDTQIDALQKKLQNL